MSNIEGKVVKVVWEGSERIDAALRRNGENDYGLYQIYGWHPAYSRGGDAVLLYIGSAVRQPFGRRLRQHHTYWMQYEQEQEKLSVRFGTLQDGSYRVEKTWDDWQQQVLDAEKLMVWWNTPAYNSRNIARPPVLDTASAYVSVENLGESGAVMAKCEWPLRVPIVVRGDDG